MKKNMLTAVLILFAACYLSAEGGQELPHIHTVAKSGTLAELRAAVRAGEDIHERDNQGRTPLLWAARDNRDP
ncbi:MAG: ankyrin repeat protein, partial [Spirochaetales bacterium]